jgi:hypothetical protein
MKDSLTTIILLFIYVILLALVPIMIGLSYQIICDILGRRKMFRKTILLHQKLDKLLILRSTCSDSYKGKFRVHLPEKEWDEIFTLVKEIKNEMVK